MHYPAKPRLPVLQRGHPLARGLVLALPLWERGGSVVRDLVQGCNATMHGSVNWKTGPEGAAVELDGSNFPYLDTGRNPSASTLITTHAVIMPVGAPAGYLWSHGGNVHWAQCFGGSIRAGTSAAAAGTTYSDGATPVGSGERHAITTVYDGSLRLYIDGILNFTISGDVTAPALPVVGSIGSGLSNFNGKISDFRQWNRGLPGAFVRWMHYDPWSLYTPGWMNGRRLRIPFLMAVASSPSAPSHRLSFILKQIRIGRFK